VNLLVSEQYICLILFYVYSLQLLLL